MEGCRYCEMDGIQTDWRYFSFCLLTMQDDILPKWLFMLELLMLSIASATIVKGGQFGEC